MKTLAETFLTKEEQDRATATFREVEVVPVQKWAILQHIMLRMITKSTGAPFKKTPQYRVG